MNTTKDLSIGLFYGSSTCYTEMAAEKIRDAILQQNADFRVDLFNVSEEPIHTAEQYSYLIMGIPTWDYGELQEDWEAIWPDIQALNLKGKKVALYGLGDQVGYPEWFQDALGYLHTEIIKCGASLVGYWPRAAYEFNASQALTQSGEHFVGLALDEENEFDKTAERIHTWVAQVLNAFLDKEQNTL